VDVCVAQSSVCIFNSDVGVISLRHVWRAYGKRMHLRSFVQYAAFTALYAIAVLFFDFCMQYDSAASKIVGIALQVATLAVVVYYIYEEYQQVRFENESIIWHFVGDMWNALDFVSLIGSLIGFAMRLEQMKDTRASRCILAVSSVFIWFKVLYFLRAFSSSGPLGELLTSSRVFYILIIIICCAGVVSMIIQIAQDIRFFLLVLLLVLLGFSQAFWLLSSEDPSTQFGTVPSALLTSFIFMLNNFNSDFEGTASPEIATILLVLYQLFMAILMLNLLIALMGVSFARVNENGLGQWRLELASTLLEQRHLLRYQHNKDESQSYRALWDEVNGVNNCVFVMKYTSELRFEDVIENHEQENRTVDSITTIVSGSSSQQTTSRAGNSSNNSDNTNSKASHEEIQALRAKLAEMENTLGKVLSIVEKLHQKE
jgi:hypothetical protein